MFLAWMAFLFASSAAMQDSTISDGLFYPVGTDKDDTISSYNSEWSLHGSYLKFNNSSYRYISISKAGVLSIDDNNQDYQLYGLLYYPKIVPFWCDVDDAANGDNFGRVSIRRISDRGTPVQDIKDLLDRASVDVHKNFPSTSSDFEARVLFIVTWHRVTYTGGGENSPKNSFQAVLIWNANQSFVMFNYGQMNYFRPTKSLPNILSTTDGRCLSGFYHWDNGTNTSSTSQAFQKVIYPNKALRNCRRMYRIDGPITEAKSTCYDSVCKSYQTFNNETKKCVDFAPAYDSPTLEGPVVVERRWVEFYCVVPTNETREDAAYNVTFLFNGQPGKLMASFIRHPPALTATLHEKYLAKNLGKLISCQVFSFWEKGENRVQTEPVISNNDYWAGIEVNPKRVDVHEGASDPVRLTIRSTIPITCGPRPEEECRLQLRLTSEKKVLVRKKESGMCVHILRDSDWKENERRAYRVGDEIELFALIDPYTSGSRSYTLSIEVDKLPRKKTQDGVDDENMWSKHKVAEIQVTHHDAPQSVCRSTGDPHVTTFDRRWYTIYPSGQFTYVQTTRGTPIEVQVRHKPCSNRQSVSCVCGVAMREGDVIIVADKCGTDSRVHYISPNKDRKGAEIRESAGGRSFELILPSKVTATAYVNYYGLTLEIHVTSSEFQRVEGLCGSFDGKRSNDLTNKSSKLLAKSIDEAVESWRVPLGKSLFDGVISDLPYVPPSIDERKYCSCTTHPSCSTSKSDKMPSSVNGNSVVDPKMPRRNARNALERRKRSLDSPEPLTDDTDYEYDSSTFTFEDPVNSTVLESGSWPTSNSVSETEARSHCGRVLWDDLPVKTRCEEFVNMTDVDVIVDKCITDIKLTDDLDWAEDKISEVQNLCVFETITTNLAERNVTVEEIVSGIEEMTALICLPQDCSGHGECRNGTCICNKGYIGSDCALYEDALPVIVRKIGLEWCDLRESFCRKIDLITKNVTDSQELTCRVEVKKISDSETRVVSRAGSLEGSQTVTCRLPTDDFVEQLRLVQGRSNASADDLDFESLPSGNPVLHYTVSISNNRQRYSNPLRFVTFDSTCFSFDKGSYSRKADTCLIRNYCFAKDKRNPLNPECELCNPSNSSDSWTRIPGSEELCDSCSSSPCPRETVCLPRSRGRYVCHDDVRTVAVVSVVTAVAILLTVATVFLLIRCPVLRHR